MNKIFIIGGLLFLTSVSLQAQKLIFSCDFEQGIPDTFSCYDKDGNEPSRGMKKYGLDVGKAWVAYTEDAGTEKANGTAYSGSWYKEPGQSNDWLVTPAITVSSGQAILSWRTHATDAAHPDGYAVYITDKGNQPEDFPAQPTFTVLEEKTAWTEHRISLKQWTGKQIYIAFVNNSTDCNLLALDDIKVFVHDHSFIYISQIPEAISSPGEVSMKGAVTSSGFLPVEGYKATLVYNGETFIEDHSELNVALGDTAYFEFSKKIPVAMDETVGYTLSVSSGEDDLLTEEGSITCFRRVVLAEEGTGNWCMYCPRGQLGLHALREKYPDNFIDIAVHMGNDPMIVPEYVAGVYGFFAAQGIPHCVMNRASDRVGDPYYDVEALFLRALSDGPVAKVRCNATLIDNNRIEVEAVSEFGKAIEPGLYNLGFIIVEDSVCGYEQANAYSGGTEKIGGLEALPDPIPAGEYYFSNVARAVYPSFSGDEEAFAATTAARTEIVTSREYELPASIKALKQVKVVAVIIDSATGEVVNADESPLDISTGISFTRMNDEAVHTEVEDGYLNVYVADDSRILSVELYTLDGKCVKRLDKVGNSCRFYAGDCKNAGLVRIITDRNTIVRKVVF